MLISRTRKETSSEARQATLAISTTSRRELAWSSFPLQGRTPKEIHAILTETFASFLPGRAKDLSAPVHFFSLVEILHLQLRYQFGWGRSTCHHQDYHAKFLRICTLLLCLLVLLPSERKSAEVLVLWTPEPACRTEVQCLCYPTYYVKRRKTHSAFSKASKWNLCSRL